MANSISPVADNKTSDIASEAASVVYSEKVRPGSRSWRSILWDKDTDMKSQEEQKLLFKIDLSILLYACLGEFLKFLDQSNISNAYVSGMKEDLKMFGNEYTNAVSMFSVGYAVGLIPSTMLIAKYRPSIVLPCAEVIWACATFATSRAQTSTQLYICRLFVGLAESPFYTSLLVVLGTWYTLSELGKRQSILFVMTQVGQLFSGYLQASVIHLNGKMGHAAWSWLFIINGTMTLPIALFGWAVFPDTPNRARKWLFSEKEKELALSRVRAAGISQPEGFKWRSIQKAFTTWHWYLFVPGYICYGLGTLAASGWFAQWLKAEGYSVYLRNIYPTLTNVITIVTVLIMGWISDYFQNRSAVMLGAFTYALFPLICLSVWNIPNALKFFSYLTLGVEYVTPLYSSWASETYKDDFAGRAFLMASMNALQYAMSTWVNILIFPSAKSPKFLIGYQMCVVFNLLAIIFLGLITYMRKRDSKRAPVPVV